MWRTFLGYHRVLRGTRTCDHLWLFADSCACGSRPQCGHVVMFLLLQYFGPGMVNAVLTLRTGNAYVHAIGYHAIAPRAYIDAPNLVRIFGVR